MPEGEQNRLAKDEETNFPAKEKRTERLRNLSLALGLVAGLASTAGVLAVGISRDSQAGTSTFSAVISKEVAIATADLRAEVSQLRDEIFAQLTSFPQSELPPGTTDQSRIELKLDELSRQVTGFNEKLAVLDTIEAAITDNPERAMSIPILRRDLDALTDDVAEAAAANQKQVDRIFTVGMWFFGLIATVALGLFTSILANSRKRSPDK